MVLSRCGAWKDFAMNHVYGHICLSKRLLPSLFINGDQTGTRLVTAMLSYDDQINHPQIVHNVSETGIPCKGQGAPQRSQGGEVRMKI